MKSEISGISRDEFFALRGKVAAAGGLTIPYIGWLGHANVGDDVCFDVLCHILQDVLAQPDAGPILRVVDSGLTLGQFDWRQARAAVLGGGSTIDSYYIDMLQPAIRAHLPIFCFAAGFQSDVELSKDQIAVISSLRDARYGSVRGTATKSVLIRMAGPVDLRVIVDGGVLTAKYYAPPASPAEVPRVVLNLLDLDYARTCALQFVDEFKDAFEFILLPFDMGNVHGFETFIAQAPQGARLYLERNFTDYETLLRWYGAAEFSINMKLHASVLSSAIGTPPIGWGGGRKIDEYFGSIDASDLRLRTFDYAALRALAAGLGGRKPAFAAKMAKLTAEVYRDHAATVRAFLASPEIGAVLEKLEGAVDVVGVRAKDCGFILLSPAGVIDRAELA